MVAFVSADWVEARLGASGLVVLDPRSPTHYLMGHLKAAVNLPLRRLFDPQGGLLPEQELATQFGLSGLGEGDVPVLYDEADGRNAAMLAWALEYLGRADVHVMDVFIERWVAERREIFYRPVRRAAREFTARVNPQVRIGLGELAGASGLTLIDFRSREEYAGEADADERPGHIPGAVCIDWRELLGEEGRLLCAQGRLQRLLEAARVKPGEPVVAYCRTGVRAAIGYHALRQIGYDVRLYDGSYAEWARSGMPVEASPRQVESR